jgi:hypothetical protein
MSSSSASCMSPSSSSSSMSRFIVTDVPSLGACWPLTLVTVLSSSSEPMSSPSESAACSQACCRRASSVLRSSSTERRVACWWGAAGPIPSGAGCWGWCEWSWAVGDDLSCRSIVSVAHVSGGQRRRGSRCARTCSYYVWSRHPGSCPGVHSRVVGVVVVGAAKSGCGAINARDGDGGAVGGRRGRQAWAAGVCGVAQRRSRRRGRGRGRSSRSSSRERRSSSED